MKWVALWFLRTALAVQFGWILFERYRLSTAWSHLLYPLVVSAAFSVLTMAPARPGWMSAPLRMFIGLAFLGAVLDRLGFFGGPGTPGVSWGNFAAFVGYTA